jgi:hypothetical protein
VTKAYLFPFACFACRRSFKRPFVAGVDVRPCPHCGEEAVRLSRKFKAPARDDVEQWKKISFLCEHGFRFASVYDENGTSVPYPETLKDAQGFVGRYTPAAPRGVPLRRRSRDRA